MLSELQNKYHDITTQKVGFYIQFPSSWSIYNNSIPAISISAISIPAIRSNGKCGFILDGKSVNSVPTLAA